MKDIATFIRESIEIPGIDVSIISMLSKGDIAIDFADNGDYADISTAKIIRKGVSTLTADVFGTSYAYNRGTRQRKDKKGLHDYSGSHLLYTCKEMANMVSPDFKTAKLKQHVWKLHKISSDAEEMLRSLKSDN